MKTEEGSSMAIKNLIIITMIFLLLIIVTINFLPKNKIFSLAKSEIDNTNTEIIKNNIQLENKQDLTSEQIINSAEQIKIATVTSRNGENTVRANSEPLIVEIEETKYIIIEEVKISKDMDLTVRTGLSKQEFKKLLTNLKQDTSGFFEQNSDLIYDLCEKYQINEIFFCGLIAGESGWNIASNHRSTYNYISLMYKGKLKQFKSVEDGLEQAAKALHNNYLTEGGCFYNGKTLQGVKTKFCPNSSTWVNLIYTCMSQMLK